MTDKPHNGEIYGWRKLTKSTLGRYRITGYFKGHPRFSDAYGFTSDVLKHDETTGEIETRNSRYTLVGASL